MTKTFKIGDTVRRINFNNGKEFPLGAVDVVTEVSSGMVYTAKYRGGNEPCNLELVHPQFKIGDRVVVNDKVTKGWFFKAGDVATVTDIRASGGYLPITLRFTKGTGYVRPDMIDLAPAKATKPVKAVKAAKAAKKPSPIVSVKVTEEAADAVILQALTTYVKETLGIDATVTKIVQTFGTAVELVLKQEAN